MTITHKLALDLQKKEDLQRLDAVQGDVLSRCVELTLTSGDNPWVIPVCDVVVRYLKPDGTAGVYDTLPDGTPAASVSGNVLMLTLAPQMLTCAGAVQVQVELNSQEQRLATFMFLVSVEQAVALNEGSEDYVNWDKFYLPQTAGAQQGQLLRIAEVGDKGQVTALEPVDPPEAELSARMEQLENHFDDVAQRSEDAMQNAADAVRLAANAVPCPQSAQAGQVLAVKSVDENGKPSQWETVEQQTGDQGDLDLHGNWLYNAGSMEVGDPSEPEAAWYVTYGIPIEHDDGRVTPVAEFWGSAADDHVLLRFVAAGVDDSDAVNKGQLDTKLPQPAAAAVVGQYLRVAAVDTDGRITAVEAVDAPGGGGGGIHIGEEEPTDPNVQIWIPTGDDDVVTLVEAPKTAKVGQTIVVSAVDDNGKPTEWEAADLSSGESGSAEEYYVYESGEITEEVSEIIVPIIEPCPTNTPVEERAEQIALAKKLISARDIVLTAHLVAPDANSTDVTTRGEVIFGLMVPGYLNTWSNRYVVQSGCTPIPSISWSTITDITAKVYMSGPSWKYTESGPWTTRSGISVSHVQMENQTGTDKVIAESGLALYGLLEGVPKGLSLKLTSTTPLGIGSYIRIEFTR